MQSTNANRITAGQIIKEAASLYRTRFRAFIVPALVVQLPIYALLLGAAAFFLIAALNFGAAAGDYTLRSYTLIGGLAAFYAVYFIALIASVLLGYHAAYAQICAILYPQSTGLRALKYAFSRYGHVLGLTMLVSLIAMAGVWAAYIPFVLGMASFTALSAAIGAVHQPLLVVGIVVLAVTESLLMIANALFSASAIAQALPASAKLGLTAGKAIRYSINHCKNTLFGLAAATGIYLLATLACMLLVAGAPIAMIAVGALDQMAILPVCCLVAALTLAISLLGTPFQYCMQCAAFNLARAQQEHTYPAPPHP